MVPRFVLPAILLVVVAGTFHASNLVAQEPNGSISGRVYHEGCDACQDQFGLLVIASDTPQPLTALSERDNMVHTDLTGRYVVSSLSDGEYLVVLLMFDVQLVVPSPETVRYQRGRGEIVTFPAVRIAVSGGQRTEAVDFVIAAPPRVEDPPPPERDNGSLDQNVNLPGTGAGVQTQEDRDIYIVVVAVVAGLALVMGLIVYLRAARRGH